jgi:hypothetical protein
MSTALLTSLLHQPLLVDLPRPGARLIMALRLTVMARRREVAELPLLNERLGCPARARLAAHIVTVVGDVWPERFTVSPRCCAALSYDEQLLGGLAGAASGDDRPGFDQAARDLLSEEIRDQLWRELIRWA